MCEFIKTGKQILPRPKGIDYDLKPKVIYRLVSKSSFFDKMIYLDELSEINTDAMYMSDKDKKLIKRVSNSFDKNITTGVLLSGLKGSGKTMMARQLCAACNCPIIVIDPDVSIKELSKFFSDTTIPIALIFDEFEKNEKLWNSKDLLTFLDGVLKDNKKLVVFTCNDDSNLNENLFDRCSRIKYFKEYSDLDKETVEYIVKDRLGDDKLHVVSDFIITYFNVRNYDNVISFVDEIKSCLDVVTEETMFDLIEDMNIKLK